ncbi:MAG TPA: hypothetical protein VJS89_03560 [Gammaproteobacteria bacterium]|nr:hypothetical protein [Gammaproteobacteria bacterium]
MSALDTVNQVAVALHHIEHKYGLELRHVGFQIKNTTVNRDKNILRKFKKYRMQYINLTKDLLQSRNSQRSNFPIGCSAGKGKPDERDSSALTFPPWSKP